jgi:spore germination cell wall hydrolase CwlJ-like protein
MSGTFKQVAVVCAVFDEVTRAEQSAFPGQLAEILPPPPGATEDWQLARIYDDEHVNFQEVFIRDRFLKPLDETFNQEDFAAQCLTAARAFGSNHEVLLTISNYLTNWTNKPMRPSSACGPFLFLEKVWMKALPSVADFGIVGSDRLVPSLQPSVAAANTAITMATFRQTLGNDHKATVAELAFTHIFGQDSANVLVKRSLDPTFDPSIESVIDSFCTGELQGTVQKSELIAELSADKPNLLDLGGVGRTVSQVLDVLKTDLAGPLLKAQQLLANIADLIDPPPVTSVVANVPADVAQLPPGDAPPFAGINTPLDQAFWPVITDDPQAMVVSYKTTADAIVGKAGRFFFADRNNGARHHVGMDVFCREGDVVVACGPGKIVNFFSFYTTASGEDSFALFVEHDGVVINYGEVKKNAREEFGWSVGDTVVAGQKIAKVSGTNMIHFETYVPGTKQNSRWLRGEARPPTLQNPTMLLLRLACGASRITTQGNQVAGSGSARIGAPTSSDLNDDDLLTLARTIYGEARGESAFGAREAVANVVMNRLRRGPPRYKDTIAKVCQQDSQFSCWNANDPNRPIIRDILPGANKAFDECYAAAEKVMRGQFRDNTGDATHYYARSIAAPSWTRAPAILTVDIGQHRFFTNVT